MFFPIRDDQPRFSTPFVNYFLIGLNVAVFFFELAVAAQGRRALNGLMFQFGVVPVHFERALAGSAHYTLGAALIMIFTSMFLHAGWSHIFFNMWGLWIFGDNVEDYVGHFTYLIFYLVCGSMAALTQIALNLNSNIPTVGASGAIAGVMGAYLVLFPRAKVWTWVVFIFFWWLPAWIPLIIWFLAQFFAGAASIADTRQTTGGIAVWAHVGGFLAGMILVKMLPRRTRAYRYGTW
ncbi:MAG TPA: rhomboid family intramembrane serine protease [Terriglobales bacterium]